MALCEAHGVDGFSTCQRCQRAMCEQCPSSGGVCQGCQLAVLDSSDRAPSGFLAGISPVVVGVLVVSLLSAFGLCLGLGPIIKALGLDHR